MHYRIKFRTADQYILKTFLGAFVFVFSLFVAIAFILILFEELEDFRERDISFGLGLTYVFLRVPHELMKATPMIVVLAMVTAVGNLIRHKEMLMLYIAGYTPLRLVVPLIVFMGFLIVGLFWFNERISGPLASRANLLMNMRVQGEQEGLTGTSGVWLFGEENRIYRAQTFYPLNYRIDGLNIFVFQGENRTLSQRIDAENAIWDPSTRQWTLHGVAIHQIQPDGSFHEEHRDDWVYDFERIPEDFGAVTQEIEQMSHGDLKRLVDNIRDAGENPWMYLPDLRIKEAFPFAVFFLGMLAYVMMVFFGTTGRASGIGLGMLAVILYFMAVSLGKSFAQTGAISPWFGAWAPNLICVLLTAYFFYRLRYEI